MARRNSSYRLGCSPRLASRSFLDRVSSIQGVRVRTEISEGLSETKSVSPKNSPSESKASRKSLPCTPLLRTSTCPCAMMKNFERSSPSRIKLLPSETSSTLNRGTNLDKTELDNPEKSGTLRRESGVSPSDRTGRGRYAQRSEAPLWSGLLDTCPPPLAPKVEAAITNAA